MAGQGPLPAGSGGPPPAGIEGVAFAGPFPVGRYAAALQERMRQIARVQVSGEVFNLRLSRAKAYFELRDGDGAMPCSMWRDAFERLGAGVADGAHVVVAGGPDYYRGSRTSSPAFSFAVTDLRIAGEGDLLAQLAVLRRQLDAEGLFLPQRRLARPSLPRCIGVVTGEGGKARDDVLAALTRRGWAGRLIWAFAPVQDRHAAPAIACALQDLAAEPEVEVVIVARGGGSLADLFAFCDETLCRTVALLRVPVIASVGHHTDRTLIDDVAAVSCSTPTHAAEAAVPVSPLEERRSLARCAAALDGHARRAILGRARHLASLSRGPGRALERHRARLHQTLRELRAASRRTLRRSAGESTAHAEGLTRRAAAALGPQDRTRRSALEGLAAALAAHDPGRTVARGYAMVRDPSGELVTSAAAARAAGEVVLGFADGGAGARIDPEPRAPVRPAVQDGPST